MADEIVAESDRELLELAAKAVGLAMKKHGPSSDGRSAALDNGLFWTPFDNDGDAFRLETKLSFSAVEWADGIEVGELETVSRGLRFIKGRSAYVKLNDHNGDKLAARRLAGVRAAAEIGKGMP